MLSDRDIKKAISEGKLTFEPAVSESQIGPASIDLRLGNSFKTFRRGNTLCLDPKKGLDPEIMEEVIREDSDPFVIRPGNFVLVATLECIKVSPYFTVRVEGKSTLARMGILVHTAGFIDPGFEGVITLEVSNLSGLPVLLYPGMFICQVAVHELRSPAEVPYNLRKKSAYKKETQGKDGGPTPANTKNLFS